MKILWALLTMAVVGSGTATAQAQSPQDPPACATALFQEAVKLGQEAVKLSEQEQPEILSQALHSFEDALSCAPDSLPITLKVEILLEMGRVRILLGDNEQARSSLSSALDLAPDSLPSTLKVEILLEMGRVQILLGDYEQALSNLFSGLDLFQQIDNPSQALREKQAWGSRNKGLALRRLQRIDDAFAAWAEAGKMFHALGDKYGEARVLSDIGLTKSLMGEHLESLEYYRQARKLCQDDPKQMERRKIRQLKAALMDFIGRAYAQINEFDLAQSYYKDALKLCRQTQYYRFIAYTLNDQGSLLVKQKKPKRALRMHMEALAELENHDSDNEDGIAETQAYLADAQGASGMYDVAIQNYQKALSHQERSDDVIGAAQTLVSLGTLATTRHDQDLALRSFTNAVELYQRVHDRVGDSRARFLMSQIHREQGKEDLARSEVETAINLAEEVRTFTPEGHLRTAYFASLDDMYRMDLDLRLKKKTVPELEQHIAFERLQHAQSRALIDALAAKMGDEDPSCRSDLASSRNKLLADLKKQNQLMQFSIGNRSGESVVEELFLKIKGLETDLEQVEALCRAEQPRLEMLLRGSISLQDVQSEILDPQSALLQFYLSDPYSYLWVVTQSSGKLAPLPSKKWLEERVQRVLMSGDAGTWTLRQEAALGDLCEKLLPALASGGIRRWIVVPDGALHSFPFALLAAKAGEGIEVVKIPSASAIRAIRRVKQAAPNGQRLQLVLFADPVFDPQDSRVKGVSGPAANSIDGLPATRRRGAPARGSYARLLYSRQEARLISKLVPPDQRVLFSDFDARLDAVAGDALDHFRVIHFATHSIVDSRHPDLSGIVFSLVSRNGRRRPGYLFLKDIYRMKLHSDLVVLSSCVSAVGRQEAGEGPMSLARAFLYAGSKAVVASLWEVDDEITAEFMAGFYRHMLNDHLSPAEALAKTQAEFRHHSVKAFRNPYYWAGFELYGDWLAR